MAEEYDPLQRMGQGNAYDGLVAGRTSKLKKAAAGALPGFVIVYLLIQLLKAGLSGNSPLPTSPSWIETERLLDDVEQLVSRPRVVPEVQLEMRIEEVRNSISKKRMLLTEEPPGPARRKRQERLAKLEAELAQLEARKAGREVKEPEPLGNPDFVGPPRELKGPLKQQ